jgi:hypothetical protein
MSVSKRKLSHHPSYYTYPECPCLLVGNRRIAKKYGWKVGDEVAVVERPDGILITKSAGPQA